MNHDDPHFLSSDEILEARIVAWVLGEASPFEVAELTRVLSEKPALQEFKKRIEAVHGQLGEAMSPTAPLQLSPERRRDLLAKLGVSPAHSGEPQEAASSINDSNTGNAAAQEPKTAATPSLVYPLPPSRRIFWMKGLSIACSLLLAFMIVKVGFLAPRARELYRSAALDEVQKRSGELPDRATPMKGYLAAIDGAKDQKESPAPSALPSSSAEVTFSASSPLPPAAKEPFGEIALGSDQPIQWVSGENFGITGYQTYADGTPDLNIGRTYVGTARSGENLSSTPVHNPEDVLGKSEINTVRYYGSIRPITPQSQRSRAFKSTYTVENRFDKFGTLAAADSFNFSGQLLEGSNKHEWKNWEAINVPLDHKFFDDRFNNWPDEISFVSNEPSNFRADIAGINRSWGAVYHLPKTTSDQLPWGTDLAVLSDRSARSSLENSSADAGKLLAKKAEALASPIALRSELTAATESVSTFSLHVSDVSFRLAVAAMARGERPDPSSIRPEEFYNAFDYGDPAANIAEKVSCRIEQSAHPELQQRNLVRIAVRVPATGRVASQPLRLTVLLDTSGSMQRDDRAAAVRRAVQVLVSLFGPADRVTLIGFSRTPRLLAESVPGDHAQTLLKIVAQTPAEGGTNLEEALKLAEQLAQRQHDASAQNRIVLLTDGAANLGNANPAQLAALIVKFRQEGIAFDACGVGTDGVNDNMLEALTRDGDGRYTLLSDADASVDEFAHQLAGAFRPAAKNVKVQVRFNPARVGHYRLIGFEQHRLKTEDFRNDQVDAAELAANEAAIAVYQVEPLPQGEGELGEVFIRFQDAATGQMIERSWTLPYDVHAAAFDRASLTMQLAGAATLVAEKLQGEPVQLEVLRGPINSLRSHYRNEKAVQNLVTLYNELRRASDRK